MAKKLKSDVSTKRQKRDGSGGAFEFKFAPVDADDPHRAKLLIKTVTRSDIRDFSTEEVQAFQRTAVRLFRGNARARRPWVHVSRAWR